VHSGTRLLPLLFYCRLNYSVVIPCEHWGPLIFLHVDKSGRGRDLSRKIERLLLAGKYVNAWKYNYVVLLERVQSAMWLDTVLTCYLFQAVPSSQIVFHLARFLKAVMTVVMASITLCPEWSLTTNTNSSEMQVSLHVLVDKRHSSGSMNLLSLRKTKNW